MGKTIAEKILSSHSNTDCYANDFIVANIDFMFSPDSNRPQAYQMFEEMGGKEVFDKNKIVHINDHHPSSPNENYANHQKGIRAFAKKHGLKLYDNGDGVCHSLIPQEGHVVPGDLVIGSDSHTTTYGALNAFSTGVGSSDLAAAMISGKLWFKVPESMKIIFSGTLQDGVYSKDLILYVLKKISAKGALYQSIEFTGDVVRKLSIDARLTISNVAIEAGAKAAIMECDEKLEKWIKERAKKDQINPVFPDKDAKYSEIIDINVTDISPQIACPHQVDNVKSIEVIDDTKITKAIVGTCTNGRLEDIRIVANILEGKKVQPGVQMFVTPATREIYKEAIKEGYIETIISSGANIGIPGCSGCTGSSFCGVPGDNENVISTANRNFIGRLGNAKANIYLASPATVAASAISGKISDCREYL